MPYRKKSARVRVKKKRKGPKSPKGWENKHPVPLWKKGFLMRLARQIHADTGCWVDVTPGKGPGVRLKVRGKSRAASTVQSSSNGVAH